MNYYNLARGIGGEVGELVIEGESGMLVLNCRLEILGRF